MLHTRRCLSTATAISILMSSTKIGPTPLSAPRMPDRDNGYHLHSGHSVQGILNIAGQIRISGVRSASTLIRWKKSRVSLSRAVSPAKNPKVVGIGETGLDYYYDSNPTTYGGKLPNTYAGRETGLPLIVHTRDADEDMADILEGEMKKGAFSGVLHCCIRRKSGPAGARHRFLHLAIGYRDVQERAGPPRYRRGCSDRPHSGRDGCTVFGTDPQSRQAERAILRGPYRRQSRRNQECKF